MGELATGVADLAIGYVQFAASRRSLLGRLLVLGAPVLIVLAVVYFVAT